MGTSQVLVSDLEEGDLFYGPIDPNDFNDYLNLELDPSNKKTTTMYSVVEIHPNLGSLVKMEVMSFSTRKTYSVSLPGNLRIVT